MFLFFLYLSERDENAKLQAVIQEKQKFILRLSSKTEKIKNSTHLKEKKVSYTQLNDSLM